MTNQLLKSYEHHRSGRLAEAELGYIEILKSDSQNFNALQLLGALYLQKQNFEDAQNTLKIALEINQSHALLFNNYGIALENIGDLTGAMNSYEKALQLNPTYKEAHISRSALNHKINLNHALEEAISQLDEIKNNDATSPFKYSVPRGYKRGVDFYGEAELRIAMQNVIFLFNQYFKKYPNLVNPQELNEKIQWIKFFYPIKFPESGDKLKNISFIPNEIQKDLNCPQIIWQSRFPKLPSNKLIKPGWYYLKSNYGSGMFKRIRYPLSPKEVMELESLCEQWLTSSFGLDTGEWWYNCFTKYILLEEEIKDLNGPISYNFHVSNGRVFYINFFQKPETGSSESPRDTRYDSDFNELPNQHSGCTRVSIKELSAKTRQKMKFFAERIGLHFPYVRIDFLIDQNQKIYLGEVTLSPTNGFESRSDELEKTLGQCVNLFAKNI